MPRRLLKLYKTTRHNDFSYKKEFNRKNGINKWDEIHTSKVTKKSLELNHPWLYTIDLKAFVVPHRRKKRVMLDITITILIFNKILKFIF